MNLPEALLVAVKQRAARDGRTVTSLVEEALRDLLDKPPSRVNAEPLPTYAAPGSRLLIDISDREALYAALDADGAK